MAASSSYNPVPDMDSFKIYSCLNGIDLENVERKWFAQLPYVDYATLRRVAHDFPWLDNRNRPTRFFQIPRSLKKLIDYIVEREPYHTLYGLYETLIKCGRDDLAQRIYNRYALPPLPHRDLELARLQNLYRETKKDETEQVLTCRPSFYCTMLGQRPLQIPRSLTGESGPPGFVTPKACTPSDAPPPFVATSPPEVPSSTPEIPPFPSEVPSSPSSSSTSAVVQPTTNECGVCFDNPKDHAIVPCGHTICGTCGVSVSRCPICNGDKTHLMRIYI